MSGSGILCGGCWLVDVSKVLDHWPQEETVAVIQEESVQGGGPGMNIAVNLRRLGANYPITAVGTVGDDVHGEFILERCCLYNLYSEHITTINGVNTSYTDALINSTNGKRTFFHSQGANALLSPEHFDFDYPDYSLFHVGAPGLHSTMDAPYAGEENGWLYVLKKAHGAGLRTNLELVSLPAEVMSKIVRPCLPYLTTVIINDVEAGAVTGIDTVSEGKTDLIAVKKAAKKLIELGVNDLAAVHFPKGCVVAVRGREPVIRYSVRLPKEKIICAVGAGDAFASGLTYGLLENWSLDESILLGHACAAVNLSSMSTNECLPPARECLDIAARWGWREGM